MFRKLAIIVIATFIRSPLLRIYAAMWTLSVLLLLQKVAQPFMLGYVVVQSGPGRGVRMALEDTRGCVHRTLTVLQPAVEVLPQMVCISL